METVIFSVNMIFIIKRTGRSISATAGYIYYKTIIRNLLLKSAGIN